MIESLYLFLYVNALLLQFFVNQSLMETTVRRSLNPTTTNHHPKPRRVCFSFAAYAKNVIDQLKACNVPVEEGLSNDEFAAIESTFHFTFPPDLRSILQEGLPVDPSFPNWRSSSFQQLQILLNLPILGICKEVSRHGFWVDTWGEKPQDLYEADKLAKGFLKKAPVLVPIYRDYYIPSNPNLAGNPVFYVHGGECRLSSFDVAGFFQQADFGLKEGVKSKRRVSLSHLLSAPAWAATEARTIEFWTELAGKGGEVGACGDARWWRCNGDLKRCLEDACTRLRKGGWKEVDIMEMMMMDGGDKKSNWTERRAGRNRGAVVRNGRALSLKLLRAGWSTEDVVDSLGWAVDQNGHGVPDVESSWLDFQHTTSRLLEAI